MKKYKLIVGDWSEDGHCKTKTFIIESNHNPEKVYKLGKFNLKERCENNDYVPRKWFEELNIPYRDTKEDMVRVGEANIYLQLYLAICKQGMENFKCEIVEPEAITIGGYGLEEFTEW